MKIKHEENLCTAIFRRLNKIGFNEENVENEYIHLNFIMFFLKNVLQPSYFSEENYELVLSPKSMSVDFSGDEKTLIAKTSYEEDRCFLKISYDKYTICFEANDNPINIFINDGDNEEIFKIDKKEESFTYYFKKLNKNDVEDKELYCGVLTSINTCIDNKEYFAYERMFPKAVYQKGFWEKIKDIKHHKKVIAISKSNSNFSIYDDVILIFNELQKEKEKMLEPQEKNQHLLKIKTQGNL